jgi:hypothetical protein
MFIFLAGPSDRNTRRCFCFILTLVFVSASGCTPAKHSENVKQGDADYPIANLHPVDISNFTVIIPASIKAKLSQGYIARSAGGSVDSGPHCAYIQTMSQARIQYWVAPELELTPTAPDAFSGQVIQDRYLPGWCSWGFAGVWYSIGNGAPDHAELLRVSGNVSPIANGRLDVWCIHSRKRDPKLPVACMDIRGLRSQFSEEVSEATLAVIAASGGGHDIPVLISPGVRDFIIQFHDLDATDRDLRLRVN